MKIKLTLLLILFNAFYSTNFAQKKFELADVAKIVNISSPQISPDGKSIAIVVSRADLTSNRYNTELVVVDIESRKQKTLTRDRISVSNPKWSPNGNEIAFTSKVGTGKDAVSQISVLSLTGGDARQLTKTTKGVQHFAWNPNAESIAYVTEDEAVRSKEIEKGYTDFEAANNDMFIGKQPTPSHIWLVNLISGEQKRLTSGTWSLPVTIPPGPPSSPLNWHPDGKSILFTKCISPYSGDGQFRTIQILNIEDGSIKQITKRTKLEAYPSFSPDGKSISYWHKKAGVNENTMEIWITSAQGTEGKNICNKIDRDIYLSQWMPDSQNVLIGGHDDNKTSLWTVGMDGEFKAINLGKVAPNWGFWIDATVGKAGQIAFTGSETNHPSELYYLPSLNSTPIKLTNFNKEISEKSLGKTETLRWENEGLKHSGIVTYPANFDKNKKYPLILVIHGGPNAASVEQFSRLAQLMANEGYFVFEPNYRGSDNLGSAYKLDIVQDAGVGPGKDVMAGLAKLKNTGMIDTSKIGVSGWSYGGFMTVWLAGHYSGWKAAVAGAAVTDWVDQYNLSDSNVARATALGGSPWVGDNMKKYVEQSPITNAAKIKAPTLILANTGDPRVPITQSYKLYHALKDNGTTTKFIAWPIAAHNASDPVSQMERDRLWIDWMNQYLK